jgi:23S rRNA (adenine1618-N6)-methyltransferase
MTNPPFYLSEAELVASAKEKSRPPFSACTGAPVEMVTEGGEVGFVSRILEESLVLRERVQWYTSMLGKHSSLETLVEMLRAKGIDNYAITEFIQGNKTRRWAIGWSFGAMRPSQGAGGGIKAARYKKLLPPAVEAEVFTTELDAGIGQLGDKTSQLMASLDLAHWQWNRENLRGIGRARRNVWGRLWRRKKLRQQQGKEEKDETSEDEDEECAFGFEISIRAQRTEVSVVCRWVEGHNISLFESFLGFLRSRLKPSP